MCIGDELATDCGEILPRIRAGMLLYMTPESTGSGDDRKPANQRRRTCVSLANDTKGSGCEGVGGAAHPFASGRSGHGAHVLFTLKRIPRKLKNDENNFAKTREARKLPMEGIYDYMITSSVCLSVLFVCQMTNMTNMTNDPFDRNQLTQTERP